MRNLAIKFNLNYCDFHDPIILLFLQLEVWNTSGMGCFKDVEMLVLILYSSSVRQSFF